MRFTADYDEEVTLRDGLRVHVRLIRPSDKARLESGFRRLSPTSRYQRFFSGRGDLTAAELRYLTECDGIDHVGIAAETCPGAGAEAEGVGTARFIRNREHPETAEAAVAVIDEYQRRGIGRLLLSRLIEAARERGIESLYCNVLSSNRAMRTMILEAAPGAVFRGGVEGGVLTVDVPLDALGVKEEGPQQPLGRLLSLVGQGLVLVRHVLHQDDKKTEPAAFSRG